MKYIQLKPLSSGYEMQFKSGVKMTLPSSHGLYIADSACGDGKTTMIREIAKVMSTSGVLIVTQTTEAADNIYDDLCKSVPKEGVCLLHSQAKAETFLVEHRENPMMLWKYPILIITAVRFQHYPVDLFLTFGPLGNMFRGVVLIDEIISFFPEHPVDINRLLPDISYIAATKTSRKGKFVKEIKTDTNTYYQYLYKKPSIMEAGIKSNLTHREHFKNPLAKYRLQEVLKYISSSGLPQVPSFNVEILSANSTVILFDGTADVLFPGDSRLLSSGSSVKKYSSDITFKQFHLCFRRRNGSDWNPDNLNVFGDELFKWIAKMTLTEKVLIITWKDIDKKIKTKATTDELETKEVFNFTDILSELLDDRGADKNNYGIIYRGSGLERGCNIYRDFENIIFLGEWFISDDITPKLNDVFQSNSTMTDYKKSLLIQSICRLRIRQHLGQPIKVYFSDDMDYNLMYQVQEYFKENSKSGCKINGIQEPLPKLDKREKNHLFDIAILAGRYPQLINSITSKTPLTLDIPKAELFLILPKDRKSVDRYKSLINYLTSQSITLNII